MLIDHLNTRIPEVPFDRDAMMEDRPAERWGAAELRRAPRAVWADGHMIDQVIEIDLYLCTDDLESDWLNEVQEALAEFGEESGEDIGWQLPERVYLPTIDRALWRWALQMFGPLEIETEAGGA